jgi:Integrase core domain
VLAIEVDTSLPGGRVVRVLERLALEYGAPHEIVLDNGPELAGKAVDHWAYARGVVLRFIEPGKPVQNAFIESFHGRLRDECLNRHSFLGLNDARRTIETWRQDYNRARPHSALGYRSPEEFRRFFEETAVMRQEWDGLSGYVDQTMGQVKQSPTNPVGRSENGCGPIEPDASLYALAWTSRRKSRVRSSRGAPKISCGVPSSTITP